jgi:threonine/homoserine/homoserine lactone efflux protein
MRTLIPFILVALALFTAGCIAYIAWEMSSDKVDRQPESANNSNSHSQSDSGDR